MNVPICARESDALEVALGGGWPACADADLRAHVDRCPICADVVAIAVAMQEEHARACQQAHVPSAGLVWWRAELRARQEAMRRAARPMTLVQGIAAACFLTALLTMASLFSPWVRAELRDLADLPSALAPLDTTALSGLLTQFGPTLALALGVWLVLVPVALYVVFSRD